MRRNLACECLKFRMGAYVSTPSRSDARAYCRAVGLALESPELRSSDALATVETFVLLKTHAWDRGTTVAHARITKLAAGLHARKSSLMARGADSASERETLRGCGVNLFMVGSLPARLSGTVALATPLLEA